MDHTSKKGLITALSCYIIWGLLPLYWALLNHVSPYNILA
ncbi:MAG: EamA family transporter RarD, partial [Veillonella sp.]|nr:EamA family transporter RarD [Veillonella sp.]